MVQDLGAAVPVAATKALTTGKLTVTLTATLASPAVRTAVPGVLLLQDGHLAVLPGMGYVGVAHLDWSFTRSRSGTLVGVFVEDGRLNTASVLPTTTVIHGAGAAAQDVWIAAGRTFAVVPDGLVEVTLRDGMLPTAGGRLSVYPQSTLLGYGAAVQTPLSATYVLVPQVGAAVAQCRVSELDGLKPLAAVGRGRVAVVALVDRQGTYRRAVVRIADDLRSVLRVTVEDAPDGDLNDVILDGDLHLHLDGQGVLTVIPAVGPTVVLDVPGLGAGRLHAGPSGVYCALGPDLYKLSFAG